MNGIGDAVLLLPESYDLPENVGFSEFSFLPTMDLSRPMYSTCSIWIYNAPSSITSWQAAKR